MMDGGKEHNQKIQDEIANTKISNSDRKINRLFKGQQVADTCR